MRNALFTQMLKGNVCGVWVWVHRFWIVCFVSGGGTWMRLWIMVSSSQTDDQLKILEAAIKENAKKWLATGYFQYHIFVWETGCLAFVTQTIIFYIHQTSLLRLSTYLHLFRKLQCQKFHVLDELYHETMAFMGRGYFRLKLEFVVQHK